MIWPENYLLQMACWLAGFWLVYMAALRKETFFELTRWYLVLGLLLSLVLPFFPVRYEVVRPAVDFQPLTTLMVTAAVPAGQSLTLSDIIRVIYLLGIGVCLIRFVWQVISLYRLRRKGHNLKFEGIKVFKLEKETAPFSFFSTIYVSKTMCGEAELKTVITHEKVHIDERHWADLLLLEVARALQWFNPLMLLYRKAMMQNHEFLADQGSIRQGVSARTYKAILANQMLGVQVLPVTSGFSHFNSTKRIFMMNKNRTTPVKKLKLLWVLPVIALLLMAFAKPRYVSGHTPDALNQSAMVIKGKVTDEKGEALPGASVILRNSTVGTLSDIKGNFNLNGIKPGDEIVVSFVGFETVVAKAEKDINVVMKKAVISIELSKGETAPPPPAPTLNIRGVEPGKSPLLIVDGQISKQSVDQIDADQIAELYVLKGKEAIEKYGDQAKDGAIEIITKKSGAKNKTTGNEKSGDEEVFVVVEEMPQYPGGVEALTRYIRTEASKANVKGYAVVSFTVDSKGAVTEVRIDKSSSEACSKPAEKIIKAMAVWKPGMQRGKAVSVKYRLKVEFGSSDSSVLPLEKVKLDSFVENNEQVPEFKGNLSAFIREKTDHLNVTGKSVLQFKIGKDGKAKDPKIVESKSEIFKQIASEIVDNMPVWEPGKQNGKLSESICQIDFDFDSGCMAIRFKLI